MAVLMIYEILSPVLLEVPAEVLLHLADVIDMEFLQTDNIRILGSDELYDRIHALRLALQAFGFFELRESPYIIGNYL